MSATCSICTKSLAVIVLAISLLLVGCSGIFHEELRVDPVIVDDVREAVEVLAATRTESHYDGVTTIEEELIIAIEATNTQQALQRVSKLLSGHGWRAVGEPTREFMRMELNKPRKTTAKLRSTRFVETTGAMGPQRQKALAEARTKNDSKKLLFLVLEAGE